MHWYNKKLTNIRMFTVGLLWFGVLVSCDTYFKKQPDHQPLARVGEAYLYKKDLQTLKLGNLSKEDSTALVTNYINNWAYKQLLLSKAKINLPQEKIKIFEDLVANYRTDLYTNAYKEALVLKSEDTLVTDSQLLDFYEKSKENFRLKERIVQLRFLELPKQNLDRELITAKLKRFNEADRRYLDSISVQFKKMNLNDSIWVGLSRISEEIPLLNADNQAKYLKKSQFFELQDSLGVSLMKINNVLEINDIAPLSYIEPTIRQLLLNRRKLNYMKKLEIEILDEGVKEKVFEVYEKDK